MQLRLFLETKGYQRVSLKKLITGHYKVAVRVNGVAGEFILDTGASTSCIGFKDSLLFLLKNEASDIKAAGAGAINMHTQIAKNNILSFGNKKTYKVDFILFDMSHVNQAIEQVEEKKIHGIIGADFLKKTRAIIDYGRNCMYIK
jgi:predicted rRNA methylase YqxC with S4 and FtsJ domains